MSIQRLPRLIWALPVAAVVLAGCGSSDAAPVGAPAEASTSITATTPATSREPKPTDESDPADQVGSYVDYADYRGDPAKYTGTKVVLFFHAPWCPSCRATEQDVLARRDSLPAGLTLVKTDYDSERDLKKKYGVTTQHTFVLVDPAGDEQKQWSGSLTVDDIVTKAG
jgi:thioredoxin 1